MQEFSHAFSRGRFSESQGQSTGVGRRRVATSDFVISPRCLGCFFVKREICPPTPNATPPTLTYVRPRQVMHIKVCT